MTDAGDEGAPAKLRINVVALISEDIVGKFLVVVEDSSGMDELQNKISKTLRMAGIQATILRMINEAKSVLPFEELCSDVLRDGETVLVVLSGDDGVEMQNHPAMSEEEEPDEELLGGGEQMARQTAIPGPQEVLYEETGPLEVLQTMAPPVAMEPPPEYPDEWLVDGLTPKLRDVINVCKTKPHMVFKTEQKYIPALKKYVAARFFQSSKSFIPLFMKPQGRLGSFGGAPLPVQYNVPKVEVLRFKRDQERLLEDSETRCEQLRACVSALDALLAKGMKESDAITVMLPYDYEESAQASGTLMEAETPLFADVIGRSVVYVIDCSGSAGKHLPYMKAAIKRVLYQQLPHKERFNLITFTSISGSVRDFAGALVPPTQEMLEKAEDWVDGLKASSCAAGRGNTLDALRLALAYRHTDAVVLATGGSDPRSRIDARSAGPTPGFVLQGVRALNVNGAAVHVVALDTPAEDAAFLRRLAEDNRGTYVARPLTNERNDGKEIVGTYERRYTSWRTNLVNELSRKREQSFRTSRLTIGGQQRILEVMLEEQDVIKAAVNEEVKCAERLLNSADRPAAFPGTDRDQLKDLQRDMKRSASVKVGGGYLYEQDGPDDVGLDQLFEVKSAVPWTMNSETMAVGPHIVPANPGVGDQRQPKFPPSVVPLEPGTLPMPAARAPSPRPKRRPKPARPKVTERAPSAQRQPSADRAAGGPRAQQKLKPPPRKAAPPAAPAPPAPVAPAVERRWSF